MLILGDESDHKGQVPYITFFLVALNVLVFGLQGLLGEPLTTGFSLVPREIVEFRDLNGKQRLQVKVPFSRYYDTSGKEHLRFETRWIDIDHYPGPFPIVLTLVTSVFLHGSLAHLIGNMWFLLVFGRNVECALGHGRFIAFYLACGALAGLVHVVSDPQSIIPCLGASGAISGVMGAYVAIHPLNKIKVWMGLWLGVWELPALVVIGFWFLFQYLAAVWSLDDEGIGGVAYWAHVGGFVAGIALIQGTVLYLRWQLARKPETDDATADEQLVGATTAIEDALPDPFAVCLPPTPPPAPKPSDRCR